MAEKSVIIPLNNFFQDGPLFVQPTSKITCKFIPVGNVKVLPKKYQTVKVSPHKAFGSLVDHLKTVLSEEVIYAYVQCSFVPHEDTQVGDLHEFFGVGAELNIHYSTIPQWC